MGSGIAAATLKSEVPVAITDANADALATRREASPRRSRLQPQNKGPELAKTLKLAPLLVGDASRGGDSPPATW